MNLLENIIYFLLKKYESRHTPIYFYIHDLYTQYTR